MRFPNWSTAIVVSPYVSDSFPLASLGTSFMARALLLVVRSGLKRCDWNSIDGLWVVLPVLFCYCAYVFHVDPAVTVNVALRQIMHVQ
jgi:hypothetical protein